MRESDLSADTRVLCVSGVVEQSEVQRLRDALAEGRPTSVSESRADRVPLAQDVHGSFETIFIVTGSESHQP